MLYQDRYTMVYWRGVLWRGVLEVGMGRSLTVPIAVAGGSHEHRNWSGHGVGVSPRRDCGSGREVNCGWLTAGP
jgi:hypothetical protein